MKKWISILIFLLLPVFAWANGTVVIVTSIASSGPSYYAQDDFDNDSGGTWDSIEGATAYDGTIYYGASGKSLDCDPDVEIVREAAAADGADADELWIRFAFRFDDALADGKYINVVQLIDSTNTKDFLLFITDADGAGDGDDVLRVWEGVGGVSDWGATALSPATWYIAEIHWKKGDGTDGTLECWLADAGGTECALTAKDWSDDNGGTDYDIETYEVGNVWENVNTTGIRIDDVDAADGRIG